MISTELPGATDCCQARQCRTPEQTIRRELAAFYRARSNNELDLRSLKVTLQMDMLGCRTAELDRREIWVDVLADHLIRTIMAQAAAGETLAERCPGFSDESYGWAVNDGFTETRK